MLKRIFVLTALVALLIGSVAATPPPPLVVSRLGVAQVQGQRVIVEVIVVVPPGADANEVALAALREQGARPFQSAEFSTTGLVWNQFFDSAGDNDFVTQNYNPAGEPAGGKAALMGTHSTWTAPHTSRFAFNYGAETGRCPSLVRECPGPQRLDGNNDVAWLRLSGANTLGVTWFTTQDPDEADMALNTAFSWFTDGRDYDVESVFLHENGHVAGLGHSDVKEAVMYPYYLGVRHVLHQDDIDGISSLYPAAVATGSIAGTVTNASDGNAIDGATVSVVTGQSATTAPDGTYTIADVPTGERSVTASADGFESQTKTATVIENQTTIVDFALNPVTAGTTVTVKSIDYATQGGRNQDKHLNITVALLDDLGNPVGGASVSIDLFLESLLYGSGTGTTGTDGTVTFSATNAPSGCYTETGSVFKEGLIWDGSWPDSLPTDPFCK